MVTTAVDVAVVVGHANTIYMYSITKQQRIEQFSFLYTINEIPIHVQRMATIDTKTYYIKNIGLPHHS